MRRRLSMITLIRSTTWPLASANPVQAYSLHPRMALTPRYGGLATISHTRAAQRENVGLKQTHASLQAYAATLRAPPRGRHADIVASMRAGGSLCEMRRAADQ